MTEGILQRLRHLVISHARSGLDIIEHSKRLYSSRYQLPMMGFCTLHLGDALIRHSPNEPAASKVVSFCMDVLQQARAGFTIYGPLQELFRRAAVEYGVNLPGDIDELMEPRQIYDTDDILDACTRLSYTQPLDQILDNIDRSVASEWESQLDQLINVPNEEVERASTRDRYMQIKSLLNG